MSFNKMGQAGNDRYASTAQVALALGVSVTTVKRWVDDAVLPAHRTAGGHRKVLLADVIRLVRDGKLPDADLSQLLPVLDRETPSAESIRNEFAAAVESVDSDLIRAVIHGAHRAGMALETLADQIIAPVMSQVGHDWELGKTTVMMEHRITQACVSALYELRGFLRVADEPDAPVAVGGAPENDHYIIPSLLAQLSLSDVGWKAVNLGPHTPAAAFKNAIQDLAPKLVWLSVSHLPDPVQFLKDYRDVYDFAEKRGIAVAVGGRGLTESVRTQMAYTSFGDRLSQLVAFAKTLHRRPGRPRRGRPPKHPQ